MGPRADTPAPWHPAQLAPRPDAAGTVASCRPQRSGPRRRVNANRGPNHKEAGSSWLTPTLWTAASLDPPTTSLKRAKQNAPSSHSWVDEHPSQLTIPEVARVFYAPPADFRKNDVVERAIRELVGAGLLHCEGAFLVPTRAALYFVGLEGE